MIADDYAAIAGRMRELQAERHNAVRVIVSLDAVDGQSVARFFKENASVITKVIADAVSGAKGGGKGGSGNGRGLFSGPRSP